MDYAKLKTEFAEIIELVNSVPVTLQERCFTILVERLLDEGKPARKSDAADETDNNGNGGNKDKGRQGTPLKTDGQFRAFMKRTSLEQSTIEAVVMVEDTEVHFIKEPGHNNVALGQNEWALLLALKNGLLGKGLTVDPEAVRSVSQDKGFYSQANFLANFKGQKYSSWYKGEMVKHGEAQTLTPAGELALASLLRSLAGDVGK